MMFDELFKPIPALILATIAVAIVVLGPVTCAMNDAQQITERTRVACSGDLTDAARSSVCTLALTQRPVRQ
ncbi:hypothetical protein UFOVP810_22 [uncultured Caudovirales phage]|uniref:Uncharacterized protein n=1 Tax=uncultured Caudovirales phage TaxID=2100421 RepID=A0A6J5P295_9CAUD|nr:hypothetical protein UFOVP810_22 [uncultured Caudovirales phage]